jgi:hypothetical protein
MDDDLFDRINQLIDEEHNIEGKAAPGEPLTDNDTARLQELEVRLDQCWDLLRQRRARRDAGLDPGQAAIRRAETVEGYQQ